MSGYTGGTLGGQTSAGGDDAYVREYDMGGNEVGTHQFGTTATDYAFQNAVDPLGLYVSGLTADALPGQTNLGGEDVFVVKLPAIGTITGTLTHATTGRRLNGVLVSIDTGQSTTTKKGGHYLINDVPAGSPRIPKTH